MFSPSKCPKFYTTIISGGKEFTPKEGDFFSKLKLGKLAVFSKIHNLNKIPTLYILCKYYIKTKKFLFPSFY